ncbi:MAG TPA: sodium:alanine symporter family protein [Sediminispirochaeta sp.]|nr:sodium:alanine symporter family protein [Sediminispirochaeta sp.]
MQAIMDVLGAFSGFMWGWPLIIIISVTAVVYSIVLKFFQFRKFGYITKNTFGKMFDKTVRGEGTLTPFQAASSALAGTLGVGNIAGVGVAVGIGGPGALFWMWVVALLAAVAKFAEVVLGIHFREKGDDGVYRGGFMYMVKKGLGSKWAWLAYFWSFLFFIQFLVGGAVQSNALSDVLSHSFGTDKLVSGIVIAVLVGLVILGGIKRIGKVAEKLVPLMAVIYFVGALIILIINIANVPAALATIVKTAFTGMAPAGGFAGSTLIMVIQNGFARGVYSNEAGMGTSPVAHATATTDHPVRQGMWGIFEVFVDTIVMCTMTGLVIMSTGALSTGEVGASLTATAFQQGLPGPGDLIVTVSTIFFAYTTILVAAFYSETGGVYCFGSKIIYPFRVVFLIGLVVGSIGGLQMVWGLFDSFMAATVAINLIVIVILHKIVVDLTKDYFAKEKEAA